MSERTEAPTPRRMGEARQRGEVARSPEVNAAVALLVGFWLLRGAGPRLAGALQALVRDVVLDLPLDLHGAWLRERIALIALRLAPSMATILFGLLAAGVAASLAQTGWVWASKRVGLDFTRLNPISGLKRIFSAQGLIELGRALVKLGVVAWTAYSYYRGQLEQVLSLGQGSLAEAVGRWAGLAYGLGVRVGGVYLLLAAVDYGYQRWRVTRDLRMTREEIKEEMKSAEGDPLLRSRIRAQQRRLARRAQLSRVPKADVVVTNPTHFAVALVYNRERMAAPRLVAKGLGALAQRIKAVAAEHDVPVVENPPLARALYRSVEVDQEVPPELYVTVAEVLAFVYNLRAARRAALTRP